MRPCKMSAGRRQAQTLQLLETAVFWDANRACALFTIQAPTVYSPHWSKLSEEYNASCVSLVAALISKVKHCCAFVWEIMRVLIGMFDRLLVSCLWSSYSCAQNYVTLTKQMRVMRFGWSWKTEYWIRIQVCRQQLDWKCLFFCEYIFLNIFLSLYPKEWLLALKVLILLLINIYLKTATSSFQ